MRWSDDNIMCMLQVSLQLVVPVELHVATRLDARKEGAIVLLKVAATVTCTEVSCITAKFRTEYSPLGRSRVTALNDCDDSTPGFDHPLAEAV